MYGQDRNAMRQIFFDAWRKAQNNEILEPLENLIVEIIERHPEYQALMNNPEHLDKDYDPALGETNPFLHLAMHLALKEQLDSRNPTPLPKLHKKLVNKLGDSHEAEHRIMACLSESVWQAQRYQQDFDVNQYLSCVKKQLRN